MMVPLLEPVCPYLPDMMDAVLLQTASQPAEISCAWGAEEGKRCPGHCNHLDPCRQHDQRNLTLAINPASCHICMPSTTHYATVIQLPSFSRLRADQLSACMRDTERTLIGTLAVKEFVNHPQSLFRWNDFARPHDLVPCLASFHSNKTAEGQGVVLFCLPNQTNRIMQPSEKILDFGSASLCSQKNNEEPLTYLVFSQQLHHVWSLHSAGMDSYP